MVGTKLLVSFTERTEQAVQRHSNTLIEAIILRDRVLGTMNQVVDIHYTEIHRYDPEWIILWMTVGDTALTSIMPVMYVRYPGFVK